MLTVDHVSGERIEAGLGLGLTVDPGDRMIGVDNWDNPERAARFGEYIRVGSCSSTPMAVYYAIEDQRDVMEQAAADVVPNLRTG